MNSHIPSFFEFTANGDPPPDHGESDYPLSFRVAHLVTFPSLE